ncbi:hypothetical protein J437_LFUL016070 [Ladona fulva]|uniref:Chromatin assembly factor 1 subunit A n=1 Tax=Ladona fulva TaxID=123851 RepID=A0A8K0KK05_LADFU|nr:hypothetical protein J437_LFUL016070 [Ladona fulva]
MDTPRRDVAGGASVDSASKKLRQALLPFQVISPVGVSSASKKRKIIDDTDAKVSKNLRIEKTPPDIIDLSEAKENVNLEVKKSETLCNSSATPPKKEMSAEPVDDEEVMCLTLESPGEESAENTCNKPAKEDKALTEPLKKCMSEEPTENAADATMDTESTISKEDGSCNSDKFDGNKSIETDSDSDLDKTGENADSSINVSIGDSDVKVSLSGSEEMSEMNTSAASLTSTPKRQASLQKKKLLSLKKKEQREKVRQELERKKEEKRKEKEEKLLQKKREKEEEMKRRLSQKLEEKQKKEEERKQKKKQKEEERMKKEEEKLKKEEEKQKEKNRKEEEKQKKEEEKQKERQKREEEKKKLEEEEQRKKKAAAAFASFFVPKKTSSLKAQEEEQVTVEAFMPFRVKGDMRLAPVVRRILSKEDKKEIELKIADQSGKKLYLTELREKTRTPITHPETWPISELKEDVVILEDEEEDVPTSEDRLVLDPHHDERFRAKLLQFCENRRPPYWGTWRKKSSKVGPRHPFYRDEKYFDYEVDSDDEWEEEEPGESLHGSDDEKESEDEYEVDNEFFVPHGYLSDEEAAAEDADDEVVSPETQKAKLMLLGLEFEEEMKQKTKQIKPQLIVSHQYEKIFSQYKAVTSSEVIPTSFTEVPHTPSATALEGNQVSVGRKKKVFPEEAMPDLIKLLHGNRNCLKFLALEFYAHLSKGNEEDERAPGESPLASSNRVSKGSIAKKIREIASLKLCTDEGPSYGKNYWFVSDSVRAQYDLTDLPQTNHWKYNLKPKKQGKVKAETSTVDGSPTSKLVEVGDESSPTHPKKPHLITKFTKVISKEERLKQLHQMAQNNAGVTPSKANESTPVGKPSQAKSNLKCSSKSEKTTPVVSGELKVKKRVPLLVSVPRGQEIPKNYSLPSFLNQSPAAGKQQTNSKGDDGKKSPDSSDITTVAAKEDPEVVTLE